MNNSAITEENHGLTNDELDDLVASEPTAQGISYSGQDFDIQGLVRRLEKNDIVIPNFGVDDEMLDTAGFQRAFVWRKPQMDKFIESLLLGYPIPGIFFVKQADNRYLVLDGQQRLLTLKYFFEGVYDAKEFALNNVTDALRGVTYKKLSDQQRRTLENTFIQAIIVTSDGTVESLDSIYNIFERLNSGGTQLTPHEIRIALYAGSFIGFLQQLNENKNWREIYGKTSPRLRDQELVLRIVGLWLSEDSYERPLKKFLNDVTGEHRAESAADHPKIASLFSGAVELLSRSGGRDTVRLGSGQVNMAFAEAVVVGLMRRLDTRETPSIQEVETTVMSLKSSTDIIEATSRATADADNVHKRLSAASLAFEAI